MIYIPTLQALDGFIVTMTSKGHLLYISENVNDYLGHSSVRFPLIYIILHNYLNHIVTVMQIISSQIIFININIILYYII